MGGANPSPGHHGGDGLVGLHSNRSSSIIFKKCHPVFDCFLGCRQKKYWLDMMIKGREI